MQNISQQNLAGDSTYQYKQFILQNAWSNMKYKYADAFPNGHSTNVTTTFPL